MDIEIWKPVPSKGVAASSWGRICKFPVRKKMPHGGYRLYRAKPTYGVVAKASKKAKHTYMNVYYRGIGNIKVHRAVCEAFHGSPTKDKPCCLHMDGDAHNNKPENLKWGAQRENLNHPKFLEYCRSRTGENNPRVKGTLSKSREAF